MKSQQTKACCAHRHVSYERILNTNVTYSDSWECEDCKIKFTPVLVEPRWNKLAQETAEQTFAKGTPRYKQLVQDILDAIKKAVEPYKEKAWMYDELCK